MKKFLTLILAVATAVVSWAAVPELLFRDQPVEEGKTYTTGYTVEDYGFMQIYTQDAHLSMGAMKGETVCVHVEATSEVQVCSIDGQCVMGTDVLKDGVLDDGNEETPDGTILYSDLRIDLLSYDQAELKDITVKVTVWYYDTPEEVAETTVILEKKPQAGIDDVEVNYNTVKLVGKVIEYNMTVPTKLEIYNLNGALVMSAQVNGAGSIALDSLHQGIYIYKAANLAGKMLLR